MEACNGLFLFSLFYRKKALYLKIEPYTRTSFSSSDFRSLAPLTSLLRPSIPVNSLKRPLILFKRKMAPVSRLGGRGRRTHISDVSGQTYILRTSRKQTKFSKQWTLVSLNRNQLPCEGSWAVSSSLLPAIQPQKNRKFYFILLTWIWNIYLSKFNV